MDCNILYPSVGGEGGRGESSKEERLSESGVELRLDCLVRCLGWVEGVEYCLVVLAKVECDKVVYPVVPWAAIGGYHVWVLIGITGEEVLVLFPSMWGLSEVEHLIYFVLLQEGD